VKLAIFIDIDEKLAARAVKKARVLGKTLDQLIHDYVQKLADDDPERWIEEFERLSGRGDSQGQRFDRGEIHERR
jgi:mRNA-degrading endonuclease RelE of RelBE toxin-antitoxin system